MERGHIKGLPIFLSTPVISGTAKATDFKFCRNIHRFDWNKRPWKMLEIVAVGVVRKSRKYSEHPCIWRIWALHGLICDSTAFFVLPSFRITDAALFHSLIRPPYLYRCVYVQWYTCRKCMSTAMRVVIARKCSHAWTTATIVDSCDSRVSVLNYTVVTVLSLMG